MSVSPSPLIDTHAHLCADAFCDDLSAVLDRGRHAGVVAVIAMAESLADSKRNLELDRRFDVVYPAAGVHPDRVVDAEPDALLREVEAVCDLVRAHRDRFVAIGEVGLDHWRARTEPERALQEEMLLRFAALSREVELPLSVHSRSAGRPTLDLLSRAAPHAAVMHAFDGKASSAQAGFEAGYAFSAPSSMVRSRQKQKLFRHVPPELWLVETDSPVLGPDRDVRNEPANVRVAAGALADLHRMEPDEVKALTTRNARRLFPGLPGALPSGS